MEEKAAIVRANQIAEGIKAAYPPTSLDEASLNMYAIMISTLCAAKRMGWEFPELVEALAGIWERIRISGIDQPLPDDVFFNMECIKRVM